MFPVNNLQKIVLNWLGFCFKNDKFKPTPCKLDLPKNYLQEEISKIVSVTKFETKYFLEPQCSAFYDLNSQRTLLRLTYLPNLDWDSEIFGFEPK